jgi:flagellar hook assembly protein FlgD
MIQMCFGRKNLTFPESVSDLSNITSTVSPNPATSDVTFALNLKESAKNVTIEISNALGQVVKTTKVGSVAANSTSNTTISVADLSAGMYIYTINADGQKTSNKLMVK